MDMILKHGQRKGIALLLAAIGCWAVTSPAMAVTKNWGSFDLSTGSIRFTDVTEDNSLDSTVFDDEQTGPRVVGNMLVFDPIGFQSQSSNGDADLIDSTLTTMILAETDDIINTIRIDEFGDFTLGGLTNSEAIAAVGAAFFWSIDEVDNAPVSIPTQIAQLNVTGGGYWERPSDDGTAIPWTGTALLNVADLLAQYNIQGTATKISLRFDNTLQTAADEGSNAFIKKKQLKITVDSDTPVIPEPATGLIAILAIGATAARRRTV